MCARFSLVAPKDALERLLQVDLEEAPLPRYNIAPSQSALVAVNGVPRQMRWGTVPKWSSTLLINARSETVAEKPSFRDAFGRRRCLVAATSFFEWEETEAAVPCLQASLFEDAPAKTTRIRRPYAFGMHDGAPFAFAGIYEDTTPESTFVILTTRPNDLLGRIHDRMPCILDAYGREAWANPKTPPEALFPFLEPHAAAYMRAFAVDARVGNPRFEDAALLTPVGPGP